MSGTTSELNMTRIGTSEKVKVLETLEGVTSLPVELTRGIRGQVKPDRDKIRTILGMNNVIELQRHRLTKDHNSTKVTTVLVQFFMNRSVQCSDGK